MLVISFLLPIASTDTMTALVPVATTWLLVEEAMMLVDVEIDFTAVEIVRHSFIIDVPAAASLAEEAAA